MPENDPTPAARRAAAALVVSVPAPARKPMHEVTEFEHLNGLALRKVTAAGDEVLFHAEDGRTFKLYHDQDCCENVSVIGMSGPADKARGAVRSARAEVFEKWPSAESATLTIYGLRVGYDDLTFVWLGTSNGYYSERVSFTEVDARGNPL